MQFALHTLAQELPLLCALPSLGFICRSLLFSTSTWPDWFCSVSQPLQPGLGEWAGRTSLYTGVCFSWGFGHSRGTSDPVSCVPSLQAPGCDCTCSFSHSLRCQATHSVSHLSFARIAVLRRWQM